MSTVSNYPATLQTTIPRPFNLSSNEQFGQIRKQRVHAEMKEKEMNEEELGAKDASQYMALVAGANYLSQDKGGIGFIVKEVCRIMAVPRVCDWVKLKRNVTFSISSPRDKSWGFCYGVNNCTGMIGMVNRREVDFALGTFRNHLVKMEYISRISS